MKPRLAIVASHPIQYQAPWFRGLARLVDLDVFFCHRQDGYGQAAAGFGEAFEWDVPLLDGYSHHWLRNRSAAPNVSSYRGCDTPEIADVLTRARFDACIVSGWYLKSYVQAIRACRQHGVKVLLRGDSHLGTKRSALKSALKWLPYRMLLNGVDGHLYVGAANRAYLRHYGVPDERLFFVPHFVDTEFFARGAEAARADGAARAVRERFGIPSDATVAILVGKLVGHKRVDDFIRGLAGARHTHGLAAHGLVVGSGPELAALQELARRLDVPAHFPGFANQTQLPAFYAAADLLVVASAETWGLVVNEGMTCGLPAIVSDAAGCAPDLVEDGVTGATFPLGDTAKLAAAIARMHTSLMARPRELRKAVESRIARYSCSAAVDATKRAVSSVLVDVTDAWRVGERT